MLKIGGKRNIEGDIYFTSDTHFGHANIIKYCNRPYNNIHEMNKDYTETWNSIVKPRDTIFHLGDFSFNADRYVNKLNGSIVLIIGNHDKPKHFKYFDSVADHLSMMIGEFKCFLTHRPINRDHKYPKDLEPDFSVLDRFTYVISGHIHERNKIEGKNINVGWDIWKKPIHINELISYMRSLKLRKEI